MANTLQLKNDIKKIKAALASKGLSATFKNKLKVKLQKAESDLKSAKPAATKSAKSTLAKLKEQVKKKGYGVYKNAGVDLEKDADEPAMRVGRRVSKGLKANQHGNKKDNKGNVYYEYRANRLDVKQPSKKAKYPRLADGGEVDKYVEVNGTFYQKGTPQGVIDALEKARNNKTRVKIYIGDPQTGRDYHEEFDTTGTIGRSTGSIKIPLLISTSRSSGGGAILTKNILKIKDTKTGVVLYQANNYKQPNIEIVDSKMAGYSHELIIDGDLYSRHKTKRSAELLKSKLMADGGEVFDADYWEDYNEEGVGTMGIDTTKKQYVVDVRELVEEVVDEFNEDNEMDAVVTPKDFQHILSLANKFYDKKGWISKSIVYTMMMQESTGEYKKGGKVKEPTVTRGFFEDEAYEYADGGRVSSKGFKKGDILQHEGNYEYYKVIDVLGKEPATFFHTGRNTLKLEDLETGEIFTGSEARLSKIESKGMADGGVTEKEVVSSNAEMVLSQIKAVKHHADELSNVVTKKSDIEAWVVAKIQRASTDLSDITHYLEGQHQKMSMGGSVYNHLHKMDKK